MYSALLHFHSGLRWVVLILIIVNVVNAYNGMSRKKIFAPADRKLSLFALISTHLQVLLGLALYAISPRVQFSSETMSNAVLRFFTMEHTVMMLIAVILVTIGNSKAKAGNFKKEFWYYFIALLVILAAIPWPFRAMLGGGWF
ncbi:MAG: cytochrome B [Saprospiraceae bacterium]